MIRELLNKIQAYLTARCTLQDLEAWLLSNLQIILDSRDGEAIDMANQVDADLVELGEGLIDETTLRERLEGYVSLKETASLTFYETEPRDTVHATAAAETVRARVKVPGPMEDLRLAHVFA